MVDVAAPVNTAVRGPDILVRTAPPLSAVVDGPLGEVAKPPPSASNDRTDQSKGVPTEMSPEAQAAARAAKVTDTTAVDPDAESAAEPVVKEVKKTADADDEIEITVDGKMVETPPYVKREITKARNQQRAAQTAAEEAKATAKAATEALAALQVEHAALKAKAEPPKAADPEPTVAPRPARDKFDDPDAYDEAVIAWSKAEGIREAEAKLAAEKQVAEAEAARTAQEAAKAAHEAKVADINAKWQAKKNAAVEKYPDFEAITTSDSLIISDPMAAAIIQADNGTDIAYHLGQNPEEAERISKMPNVAMQMLEIGKISGRLSTPPVRAARQRPLEPIDTGTSPATDATRELSMDEWAARRTPEILGARRPFMEASPPARARAH